MAGDAPEAVAPMSAALARLRALQSTARRRVSIAALLQAAPLSLALAFAAWRTLGPAAAMVTLLLAMGAAALMLRRAVSRIDLAWIARRLDAARPELEDSTALLLQAAPLAPLQQLQRERVAARMALLPMPELRPAWPARRIVAAAAGAIVLAVLGLAWTGGAPVPAPGPAQAPISNGVPAAETLLAAISLDVTPPAYTGLPARSERRLATRAPAGSRLEWRLRFDPEPNAAQLTTHDGRRIPLEPADGEWRAALTLDASFLYRLVVEGAPPVDAGLHRLDAVTDQPPLVRVLEPDQNVVLAEPGQSAWALVFEAVDDYGLGDARLWLTLAQGSGELVEFTEFGRDIEGSGDATRRRYAPALDLEALGIGPGDDLVVRLEVADNRAPDPQLSRSASVVLRWPPPAMGAVEGFDGLMQRALPAYFRSQRQIIIDTEQLLAEQDALAPREFVARSGAIGADQQQLRLRYGQFMGEEADSDAAGDGHEHGHEHDHDAAAPPPPPRRVPNPLFADDSAHAANGLDDHHDHEGHEDPESHAHDERGRGAPPGSFGDAGDVVARYGHVHDIPEAATLFDARTREVLRAALNAMWDAEGYLRAGEPAAALPHEHRALDLVKEAQRASRIHLARVGLELPPIDESRRLGGDLAGVTDRADPLAPADAGAGPLPGLWQALQEWHGNAMDTTDATDLEAALDWILANEETLDDPLALVAAIDAVQRDPGCDACRARLRGLLWPVLPLPAAGVLSRQAVDEAGAQYLDALAGEPGP
jgi:hypothetical protein